MSVKKRKVPARVEERERAAAIAFRWARDVEEARVGSDIKQKQAVALVLRSVAEEIRGNDA